MSEEDDRIDLSKEKILTQFWECRNFELTLLWQRSAFLGVFLTLIYTGYALLWSNNLYGDLCRLRFNMMGAILTLVGIVVSFLWIAMIRGSKAWYEVYESAISAFVENYFTLEENKDFARVRGFGVEEIVGFTDEFMGKEKSSYRARRIPRNSNDFRGKSYEKFVSVLTILSLKKGGYSPSRILIMMGVISFIGFGSALLYHVQVLLFNDQLINRLSQLTELCTFRFSGAFLVVVLFIFLLIGSIHCSITSSELLRLMSKKTEHGNKKE